MCADAVKVLSALLQRLLVGPAVAYIAATVRNPVTYELFEACIAGADLVMADITHTMQPHFLHVRRDVGSGQQTRLVVIFSKTSTQSKGCALTPETGSCTQ